MKASDRASLLLDVAGRLGCLVTVPKAEAEAWRKEWRGVLASLPRPKRPARLRGPRTPRPAKPRNNPPRAAVPAGELVRPGAWVAYRPHNDLSCPETIGQVLAFVPPGVPVASVIPAEQLAHVERHAVLGGSHRLARVVLSVPGARRSLGMLRTVLAGVLATRGRLVEPPQSSRLLEPLAPGTPVSWSWHSSKGKASHNGKVLAYVPAGVPLAEACPGARYRHGMVAVSNQDRYVVKLTEPRRKKILTPAAHLIEREFLPSPASTEEACAI